MTDLQSPGERESMNAQTIISPTGERLIVLAEADYNKLKAIADRESRSASKQAKVLLLQTLAFKKGAHDD